MAQINIWICEGYLVSDCVVKPTTNGKTYCLFYIMNTPYSKTIENSGEIVDITKSTAIPCRCFDVSLNKILERYGKKGTKVILTGKCKMNPSYVDDKGNIKPPSLYMYVEEIHMQGKGIEFETRK